VVGVMVVGSVDGDMGVLRKSNGHYSDGGNQFKHG